MGTLKITGVIDINQFWPKGSSDADTTKIKLLVDERSFEYMPEGEEEFVPTKIYLGAKSKGKITTEVVSFNKKENANFITIRLQGLDAPELHFRAAPLKSGEDVTKEERALYNSINKERRQNFAQSSTALLAGMLAAFADVHGLLSAVFLTDIEYPQDAVDTYGRFVGSVLVDNLEMNVNLWLVKNGAATPAFYTSMAKEEIEGILDAWDKGKKFHNRIGKMITNDITLFDWNLLYEKPNANIIFNIGDDAGHSIMPKIYRRQVAWLVSKKAGVIPKSKKFKTYLKEYTKDQICYTDEFLKYGKDSCYKYNLEEIISADSQILKQADEIIFSETKSTLVDAKNKPIVGW